MADFSYKLLLVRLLPETIIVLGALIVLFLDQAWSRTVTPGRRSTIAIALGTITLIAAMFTLSRMGEFPSAYRGMLVLTGFTRAVKIGLLILTTATLLISRPSAFTDHIGEYVALLLMGTIGLLLLAGTEELLTAFISLELTSLSLYLLTAFNKQNIKSAEAALKYFLFGSVAAAFTLFGISLLFGLAGSTSFREIAATLRNQPLSPLLVVAIVLTAIGFAFKMAAAPLHLWAPDAYQGAPVPSAALIASGSKLASFVLFFNLFQYALPGHAGNATFSNSGPGWAAVIAAIAAVSIIVGNLLAIAQSNLRRLIAYSAVAHAGYVLIAVLAPAEQGRIAAVYYLFTYGLSIVGLFAIVALLEQSHGELQIHELTGLSRRAPAIAICLFVFILSLAGIPPLAGFFGKFYIFLAALDGSNVGGFPGLLWIVALALGASAVSLYYYLQVLKHAFVLESDSSALRLPLGSTLVICALAAATVFFGCFPETLLSRLRPASSPSQFEPGATRLSSFQP